MTLLVRKLLGTFEKRAPGPSNLSKAIFLYSVFFFIILRLNLIIVLSKRGVKKDLFSGPLNIRKSEKPRGRHNVME